MKELFTMKMDKDFHNILLSLSKQQERSMAGVIRYLVKQEAIKHGLEVPNLPSREKEARPKQLA